MKREIKTISAKVDMTPDKVVFNPIESCPSFSDIPKKFDISEPSICSEETKVSTPNSHETQSQSPNAFKSFSTSFSEENPIKQELVSKLNELKVSKVKDKAQTKSYHDDDLKIFVGGLPLELTNSEFKNYFSKFGQLSDCVIIRQKGNGRSRGFGFVTY